MIKNHQYLQKFEKQLLKKEKVNIIQNFRIVEALYEEAFVLGIIPMRNRLDGLESDITIARVVNSVSKST